MSYTKKLTMSKVVTVLFLFLSLLHSRGSFGGEASVLPLQTIETKTIVFGTVNGRFDELKLQLERIGVIDQRGSWRAGKARLVSLGNLFAKQSINSKVNQPILEFAKKLQIEAEDAGGHFHLVLGKNEVYIMVEGLYTSRTLADNQLSELGNWLFQQSFVHKQGQELFTHLGLSKISDLADLVLFNQQMKESIIDYADNWASYYRLNRANQQQQTEPLLPEILSINDTVKTIADKSLKQASYLALKQTSPVNFDGSQFCHPYFEKDRLDEKLKQTQSKRVWLTTEDKSINIRSRFSGRVQILPNFDGLAQNAETEVDSSSANKQPIVFASIASDGSTNYFDSVTGEILVPQIPQFREWNRPYGMSDEEIELFLKSATIIESSTTKEGKTKPLKLKLEKNGKQLKAVFKYVNKSGKTVRKRFYGGGDRYQHEMAAYRLDRMLGIGLVPVTVEREIDGVKGSVQLWVENMASALQLNEREILYEGTCDVTAQADLMNAFDYLIHNSDRNQTNIVFTKHDWQIWFIDHTRSFGTVLSKPVFQQGVELKPPLEFLKAVKSLSKGQLRKLKPWLNKEQMAALWERRKRLLKGKY
jgi:hypothetical protein